MDNYSYDYEEFKRDFLKNLLENNDENFTEEQLRAVADSLDYTSYNYAIIRKAREIDYASIPNIVTMYIEARQLEDYSMATLKTYRRTITTFMRFVNKDVVDVKTDDVRMFLFSYKKMHDIQNRSLDGLRIQISAFMNWCRVEDIIEKNPCEKIKPFKYEKKERCYLTQEELEYFRDAAKDSGDLRDQVIVEMLYSTGCRVSELAHLKLSDIDFKTNEVHVFGKGKKNRTTFLSPRAKILLKRYTDTRPKSDFVISSTYTPFGGVSTRTIERRIELISKKTFSCIDKEVTPHVLRHTFATQLLQNGMPIHTIQVMLGHENINTTLIYAKDSKEDIKHDYFKKI